MACESVLQGDGAVFDHRLPEGIPAAKIDLFIDSVDECFFAGEVFVQQRLRDAKALGQLSGIAHKTNFRKIFNSLLCNVFFSLWTRQAFGACLDS